mgnify:CR=1 FL=1
MDLDDIKRGLRAEIKKRENEQYATFQCNVRQMCKDVLAKLEEQESEIAELVKQKHHAKLFFDERNYAETQLRHSNYKRCLDKASYWIAVSYQCVDDKHRQNAERHHHKWLELAEKFRDKEA